MSNASAAFISALVETSVERASMLDLAQVAIETALQFIRSVQNLPPGITKHIGTYICSNIPPSATISGEKANLFTLQTDLWSQQRQLANTTREAIVATTKSHEQEACEFHLPPGTLWMPEDGMCLAHALVAAQNVRRWRRTPRFINGEATRTGHRRRDRRRAKALLGAVIAHLENRGLNAMAARLSLPGSAGHPGLEEMHHFAEVLDGKIVVIPLTLGALQPPETVGSGQTLAVLGHLVLPNGVGHFALIDAPGMHGCNSGARSSTGDSDLEVDSHMTVTAALTSGQAK